MPGCQVSLGHSETSALPCVIPKIHRNHEIVRGFKDRKRVAEKRYTENENTDDNDDDDDDDDDEDNNDNDNLPWTTQP